ncbi:hypothetical protein N7499_003124 [Penicillium canescens]|uniref:Uncharacterized protein n=1 Tax=Penicillium canescens TaxID=5083 RepID=A0AAD6N820_PENCN|nr:uncharacterized protein N7446_011996 [Penicillium canescens]KAJ6039069.1 hypothetical protein N7460_007101 [Penicillium canescens]KAJ6047162.1 hypothetical protein N7446_011996 [Penicillium canescens]KAJ6059910.1 hypothetical protein N7444_003549 [Penicillium canescens]KAJ6093793.1 hypothetical protein N7499_003124 [Penicillium canescens]KAJ6174412.1 hypothetical protein N7485_005478 [Penicillium canescens]
MQLRALFISLAMAASAFPLVSINSEDPNAWNVDIAKRGDQLLTSTETADHVNESEAPLSIENRETASIDIARRTDLTKVLGYHV